MAHYKYESKWRKGYYLPFLTSDSRVKLEQYKYLLIEITELEWQSLYQKKHLISELQQH